MLEIFEPMGAFDVLEDYLQGFWGREGLVADLYLGYGLSAAIRREETSPPPEPCPLPLLACSVRPAKPRGRVSTVGFELGDWERSWDDDAHAHAIEAVRAAIARGDVYQANVVQHLSAPFAGDPFAVALALRHLRPLRPEPLAGSGWTVVSASPELFLARRGDRLVTRPIKGTRPAGVAVEGAKDRAEHMMIVDLERNDLARVCEAGSVRWPELMAQHELAGVTHLVSTVEGRLRPGTTLGEILGATFPGGSVTGAPKISAVDLIASVEPVGRGASMGALGVLRPDGDFELALTIRTLAVADARIHLWVGGGIVWDSAPEAEIEESWVKARPILAAIGSLVAA